VLQGHEFIDVELRDSQSASRGLSITAANQREPLNDVTTTPHRRDADYYNERCAADSTDNKQVTVTSSTAPPSG